MFVLKEKITKLQFSELLIDRLSILQNDHWFINFFK